MYNIQFPCTSVPMYLDGEFLIANASKISKSMSAMVAPMKGRRPGAAASCSTAEAHSGTPVATSAAMPTGGCGHLGE